MTSKGKSSKKEEFNPFPCMSRYAAPLKKSTAPVNAATAEFVDTNLQIFPPLPKTEVSLRIQFRCSVSLVEGDVLYISLPGFKGAAQSFCLEQRPHPDGFNAAQCFRGFWSGDEKIKGKNKLKNIPAKQTLLLRVVRRIEEEKLVIIGVPFCVGIVSPDKLPANSSKIKIEGQVCCVEGGKMLKQAFITSTELKKETIVDEIDIYGRSIARVAEEGAVSKEDHYLAEALATEEVDQLWMTAQQRPPYRTRMPFPFGLRAFHAYEETGGFIKTIMESVVAHVKRRDPLALYREVARNWGVKEGALVLLADLLEVQCGIFYPGMTRAALLACHLLTMDPADVVRSFGLSGSAETLPKCSILQEIQSAFRSYDALVGLAVEARNGNSENNATAAGANGTVKSLNNNNENAIIEVYSERCDQLVKKWSSLLSCLLTASYIVDEDARKEENSGAGGNGGEEEEDRHVRSEGHRLLPPPSLYVGVRDLPSEELSYLQSLESGDWYMLPNFCVARENFPPIMALKEAAAKAKEAAATLGNSKEGGEGSKSDGETPANEEEDDNNNDDDDENNNDDDLPGENAVVFEIQDVREGLEMADLSMHPNNREWLLPFASSYRVVSVKVIPSLQSLTHVILSMEGSVAGEVGDELIPLGDRNIAAMVGDKVQSGLEQSNAYSTSVAQLIYLNIKMQARKRQHAPTLIRAQYLSHYQTVQRATQAQQALSTNAVLWQVQTHPPQLMDDGVIRPANWELVPAKYLEKIELFYLERNKTRLVLEEGMDAKNGPTLWLNLENFTLTYAGKGPRPVRRLVGPFITGEPLSIPFMEYDDLCQKPAEQEKKLLSLQQKLGLVEAPGKKSKKAVGAGGKKGGAKKTAKKGK